MKPLPESSVQALMSFMSSNSYVLTLVPVAIAFNISLLTQTPTGLSIPPAERAHVAFTNLAVLKLDCVTGFTNLLGIIPCNKPSHYCISTILFLPPIFLP